MTWASDMALIVAVREIEK